MFEQAWSVGGNDFIYGSFEDIMIDKEANDTASEFIRSKIREMVKDPETCQKLLPLDHPSDPSEPSSTPTTSRPTTVRTSTW